MLALMMVLALAACGGKTEPTPSGSGTTPSQENSDTTPNGTDKNSQTTTPPDDSSKSGEVLTQEQVIEQIGVTTGPKYLVVKYVGNGENPPLYGASKCYIVFKIFKEDGSENALGTSETWYLYDDQATFDAGYAEVKDRNSMDFKDRDHLSSLYFVMKSSLFGSRGDFSTYDELVNLIDTKSSKSDDYSTYEIVR